MQPLEKIIESIELAVVKAADSVIKSNISIVESYFNKVPAEGDKKAASAQTINLREIFDDPNFEGLYTPKTVGLQYPLMNPEAQRRAQAQENTGKHKEPNPVIHTVYVPLISLAPPATYYIDEVTVRLNVWVQTDDNGEEVLLVAAPVTSDHNYDDEDGASASAYIEVVIKRGEDSVTKQEVIRGYDRATRAEIPG